MNELLQPPHDPFSVGVLGDARWLHGIAQNLMRVDLVKDERSSSIVLSRTDFLPHPIFSGELSSMNARNWGGRHKSEDGTPRFNLHSFIGLSEEYRNRAELGYVPTDKVTAIADTLRQSLSGLEVGFREGAKNFPHNYVRITGDLAELNIEFDEPSLDAKETAESRMAEIRKEMNHPEGVHYQKTQEFMAKSEAEEPEKTPEEREEEKVWEETWKRKTREVFEQYPPTEDPRHELITIKLEGLNTGGIDSLLDSMVGGVKLTTPETFRAVLDFYAFGYASVINAFCEVESVQPPRPRVLLGSGLLKS